MYVAKHIPGKQGIGVAACENQPMGDTYFLLFWNEGPGALCSAFQWGTQISAFSYILHPHNIYTIFSQGREIPTSVFSWLRSSVPKYFRKHKEICFP